MTDHNVLAEQLQETARRLNNLTDITVTLARNEERLTSLTEKMGTYITRVDKMERDIYGPDGVIVRLTKSVTQTSIFCSLAMAIVGLAPTIFERLG